MKGVERLTGKQGTLVLIVLFLFSQSLTAQESVRPVAEAIAFSQIVNLLAGLIVVLLAFFALAFLLKRFSGFNGTNRGYMKIVDSMHLGAKERLLIVKVTDKHLLLGVSPQGIHQLCALTDELHETQKPELAGSQATFNQLLSKFKPTQA